MILFYIQSLLVMFLIVSLFGYILVVLKEKLYLKNNIIVIDKKSVTQEHIEEADTKEFLLGGVEVKAGDEVKVILSGNVKLQGIVIGGKKKENSILLVTHDDEVKKLRVSKIEKFKVISRYGKFFKVL